MSDDKKTLLRGQFMPVDERTPSGTIYPREVIERALAEYQKKIAEGRAFGCMNFGERVFDRKPIRIQDISHRVTKADFDADGNISGELEVMDTSAGRDLKKLLLEGCGISARALGFGTTREGEVGDDYRLIGFATHPAEDGFPALEVLEVEEDNDE